MKINFLPKLILLVIIITACTSEKDCKDDYVILNNSFACVNTGFSYLFCENDSNLLPIKEADTRYSYSRSIIDVIDKRLKSCDNKGQYVLLKIQVLTSMMEYDEAIKFIQKTDSTYFTYQNYFRGFAGLSSDTSRFSPYNTKSNHINYIKAFASTEKGDFESAKKFLKLIDADMSVYLSKNSNDFTILSELFSVKSVYTDSLALIAEYDSITALGNQLHKESVNDLRRMIYQNHNMLEEIKEQFDLMSEEKDKLIIDYQEEYKNRSNILDYKIPSE